MIFVALGNDYVAPDQNYGPQLCCANRLSVCRLRYCSTADRETEASSPVSIESSREKLELSEHIATRPGLYILRGFPSLICAVKVDERLGLIERPLDRAPMRSYQWGTPLSRDLHLYASGRNAHQ